MCEFLPIFHKDPNPEIRLHLPKSPPPPSIFFHFFHFFYLNGPYHPLEATLSKPSNRSHEEETLCESPPRELRRRRLGARSTSSASRPWRTRPRSAYSTSLGHHRRPPQLARIGDSLNSASASNPRHRTLGLRCLRLPRLTQRHHKEGGLPKEGKKEKIQKKRTENGLNRKSRPIAHYTFKSIGN